MFISYFRIAVLAASTAAAALFFTGCGGGGGGDSPPARVLQPIGYVGSTAPAVVSIANTPTLVTNVLFGGSSAGGVPSAAVIAGSAAQPGETATGAERATDVLHYGLDAIIGNASHGYSMPAAGTIRETNYCVSGYYTVDGYLDDVTGTGTLTFDYYNCLLDGTTYDGMIYVTVHYVDYYSMGMTMDHVLLHMSGPDINISMSGPIQIDDSVSGNSYSERLTLNHTEQDNNSGKMYKYEGFAITYLIDDAWSYYSGGSITYSGVPALMYDSIHGSLAASSIVPFEFSSITRAYPDLGGQLVMTGDQSGIQLIVASPRHVKLELDLDGVAGYEVIRYVLWSELNNVAALDLADSDGDGMHDSWEDSFGLDSSVDDAADNLDGDGLTNLEEYEQGYNPNDSSDPTPPTA